MKRKLLVVGIILLFIGVTVAPTINYTIVNASNDNDLVEATTQACGIQGYGDTTVKLTREQYQNLEQYLSEFRARLNQTTIREEAVPIFKEAVVELNKYGLLPKGMSVGQLQKLVTRQNQYIKINSLQEKFHLNQLSALDENSNYFCLIAGSTGRSGIITPITILSVGPILINVLLVMLLQKYSDFIQNFLWPLFVASVIFTLSSYFLPITLFSVITFGDDEIMPGGSPPSHYYPSNGWVFSFGLKLMKTWKGSFYGNIFSLPFPIFIILYVGIIDFTGIKIVLPGHCFYLGSALWAKMGPSPL
jgi:hypothetical protein